MGHRPEGNLPVVVGIDGSSSAADAARWAAREAARRGAPLEVVTRAQDAIPLLIAKSRRAALLVVGDRGLGRVAGLTAHADCPVVVVRGEQPSESDGPVVVGVDGSQSGEAALEFAFRTADLREALLIAVHAWTDSALDAGLVPLLSWDDVETAEHPLLAEWLAGWSEKYPDVVVQRVVVRDRPAHAVIEQATAAAARLVVVGSHGRTGVTARGSVSHAVLHHAPCPVAVVRPERTPR
ncbi:universal stress protein [Amycolatopsis balhimycina DSM 5908]|uniref:Universal stress protein n=1 Tax=Amycolatopsis balhimycina DSM 5908 TaxID=1081091 RepID=A0A428WP39_AMYBA|nr:universal stress protein [Amycolatopsis balhimycina]RSM44820.1 universal stress protein [Amycolatopsis balhimycina DSM 5908]